MNKRSEIDRLKDEQLTQEDCDKTYAQWQGQTKI